MTHCQRYFLVLMASLLAALPISMKVSNSIAAEYSVRYGGKFAVALNGDIQTFNLLTARATMITGDI